MLRYTVKSRSEETEWQEIFLSDMFLASDGSYLSGVTDRENHVSDGQTVRIYSYDTDAYDDYVVSSEDFVCQGYYIDYNYEYPIITGRSELGEKIDGIRYKDGCFYSFLYASGETGIYRYIKLFDNEINDGVFSASVESSSVTIPNIYYVEDEKITLSGQTLDVDVYTDASATTVSVGGRSGYTDIKVILYEPKDRRTFSRVVINKNEDRKLDLDDLHYAAAFNYIKYGETYNLDTYDNSISNVEENIFVFEKEVDGPNVDIMKVNVGGVDYSANTTDGFIDINGNQCSIKTDWRNARYSNNYLNVYVSDQDIRWDYGDTVIAKSNVGASISYLVQEKYVIDGGYGDVEAEPTSDSGISIFDVYMGDGYGGDYIASGDTISGFSNAKIYYVTEGNGDSAVTTYAYYEPTNKLRFEFEDGDEVTATTSSRRIHHGGVNLTIKSYSASVNEVEYIMFNGEEYDLSPKNVFDKFVKISYNNSFDYNERTSILRPLYTVGQLMDSGGSLIEDAYYGYYMNDDMGIPVAWSGDSSGNTTIWRYSFENDYFMKSSNTEYTYKELRYVVIDGVKYYADEDDEGNLYVDIDRREEYKLQVVAADGPSCVRCYAEEVGVVNLIKNNQDKFTFYKQDTVFPLDTLNDNRIEDITDETYRFFNNRFAILKPNSYVVLPMLFQNTMANNHWQEKTVQRDYFDKTMNDSINRIIDMERDVYYPAFQCEDEVKLIDELDFELHFRTRDLSDWSVVEDYTSHFSPSAIPFTYSGCNWNIIDYYYDDINDYDVEIGSSLESGKTYVWQDVTEPTGKKVMKVVKVNTPAQTRYTEDDIYYNENITKYYQPSDLLYYLNFTNDDVMYHKRNISKSFLRLSFYDSDDPNTQNLLAMSTIFMDGNKLYKIYLDNSNPNLYDDYGFVDMKNGEYSEYIGVSKEPFYIGGDGIWTYDKAYRLDSSFVVKNIFENEKSSEGFFLYLFKDFSSELHERNIYLRIQFNHAGEGKTVNFLVPKKVTEEEDGSLTYDLLDLTNSDNRTEFKKGYSLSELNSQLYTKITIKYDDVKNKYVYCFPEYMMDKKNPNKVIFNLYEVKIKDESKVDENN